MRAFRGWLLGVSLTVGVVDASLIASSACTPNQRETVLQDLSPTGSCFLNQVAAGNLDPLSILASCSGAIGATIESLIATLETYIAGAPTTSADGGLAMARLDPYRTVLTRAKALQVGGVK